MVGNHWRSDPRCHERFVLGRVRRIVIETRPRPARRRIGAGALALGALAVGLCSAIGGAGNGLAGAADAQVSIGAGATASAGATRLAAAGALAFPIKPVPRCEILANFGDPRSGGRSHEGVDILADLGQEVYAVVNGTLIGQFAVGGPNSSLSGNAWRLEAPNQDLYVYAHLSAFAPGLTVGSRVAAGQLIGYVGDTGNPGPGNYHLHIEVHPGGGDAIDPLTVLKPVPAACRVY